MRFDVTIGAQEMSRRFIGKTHIEKLSCHSLSLSSVDGMYHEKPSLETKQRRSSDVSAAELVSKVLPNQASCISAHKALL